MAEPVHIDDLPLTAAQRSKIVSVLQSNANVVANAQLSGDVTVAGEGGVLIIPVT